MFRCLSVPGNRILSAPRHRLLSDPALHSELARRDPVLGVVLDQRRRESGARFHRPADGPHIDDAVNWRQRVSAQSQLRQSDRRLDVLELVLVKFVSGNSSTSGCLRASLCLEWFHCLMPVFVVTVSGNSSTSGCPPALFSCSPR